MDDTMRTPLNNGHCPSMKTCFAKKPRQDQPALTCAYLSYRQQLAELEGLTEESVSAFTQVVGLLAVARLQKRHFFAACGATTVEKTTKKPEIPSN
jgi:hypothetical protein